MEKTRCSRALGSVALLEKFDEAKLGKAIFVEIGAAQFGKCFLPADLREVLHLLVVASTEGLESTADDAFFFFSLSRRVGVVPQYPPGINLHHCFSQEAPASPLRTHVELE
uniref:Uncharacterized protein n=1 Tax=Ascaris lumbricoides TaxID=6252 RepID=A0A0M3I9N8_ASCLU